MAWLYFLKKNNMKVFVLAPIYNRKETTLKFLRSFSDQTYREYQMVIVDDGSTDGSSEAILTEFPKTIVLKGDGNLWWTGSMNKGVEYVLSVAQDDDYVLAINDDTTVEKDYIAKLVSASKENNDAIVGSIYRDSEDKEKIYDCGARIDWKSYGYLKVSYDKNKRFTKEVDTFATRGALIPVSVMKKIGLFEKKLRHYAADYEYFLRAKKNGYKLIVSYEAAVFGSEKDRAVRSLSRVQPFLNVWKRNFSIKSANNIYNHFFLIWHYCPSFKYKIKHSCTLIAYNVFLFLNSILLHPFLIIKNKTRLIGK